MKRNPAIIFGLAVVLLIAYFIFQRNKDNESVANMVEKDARLFSGNPISAGSRFTEGFVKALDRLRPLPVNYDKVVIVELDGDYFECTLHAADGKRYLVFGKKAGDEFLVYKDILLMRPE